MKKAILKYVRHKPILRKILSFFYLQYIRIYNTFKNVTFAKIYHIDPQKIIYISETYFDIFEKEGIRASGDRDLGEKKCIDSATYRGLHERFVEGKDRKETVYYTEYMPRIFQGEVLWHCTNEEEFMARCAGIDALYKDIQANGFKMNTSDITGTYDQVTVNVTRDGSFLLNDGEHRLAIAKILSIKTIPVRIIARHEHRYDLIMYLRGILPDQTSYQSFDHIDLDTNFTIEHPCQNRREMMQEHIPEAKKGSKSLDIGGNIGYFTKKLEKCGYNAYIVEHESFWIKTLEKIKGFFGYTYTIIAEDIFTREGIENNSFDVVIAINILHHFTKTQVFFKKLTRLLTNLNTRCIILETHSMQEEQMIGAYKNFTPIEFVEYIMECTGLTSYEKIGETDADRILFKIY